MRDLLIDFCWWVLERLLDLGAAILDVVLFRGRTSRTRRPVRASRREQRRAREAKARIEPRRQDAVEPPSMPPVTMDPRDAAGPEWTLPRSPGKNRSE